METGENNPIHIQTENFNIGLAGSYHLSIQLGIYHFSYCLLNTTTITYDYVKKYSLNSSENTATEITEIINNDTILKAEFSSQSIAFVNFPSTLVPNNLYKKEEAEIQLAFNTKVNGTVLADNIVSQKAHLIYSVPESILTIVSNFFPKAKYKAQESILIQEYSQLNTEKKNAYLYLNEQKVGITIFNGDKLIFNNSFKYTSKEDLLYYVLFSFEQLKLSADSIDVTVFGTIEDTNESFSLMYEYIRNIKLGKRPHQFTFPAEFNTLADHKYFGLFTQILCV
ncbi:MAG: DUF3822 family protein [Flavobacteriales bacterium]|jgi:hypothetical protein|nr:DUF3822 family protein [Flavobacteriales bacterium]MBT5089858.1 DUF3822 family protein [Flavobacteriales bacterium]MBT5749730.1 DUF3822 family protein [Flavobacteriales bacterium]